MGNGGNAKRSIMTVIGLVLSIVAAFVVKGAIPEAYSAYSGLAFFGVIIIVTGLVGFIAAKIFH